MQIWCEVATPRILQELGRLPVLLSGRFEKETTVHRPISLMKFHPSILTPPNSLALADRLFAPCSVALSLPARLRCLSLLREWVSVDN